MLDDSGIGFAENVNLYKSLLSESLAVQMANQAPAPKVAEFLLHTNHSKIGVFFQFDCAESVDIIRTVSG